MADNGKVIEAGWESLRAAWIPADAPQRQVDDLRAAFFAGATHLLHSMVTIMDHGAEVTAADLQRMAAIDWELREFGSNFTLHNLATDGTA